MRSRRRAKVFVPPSCDVIQDMRGYSQKILCFPDPLVGRWATRGGWYDIERNGAAYGVKAYGSVGLTARGVATVTGNIVVFTIGNSASQPYEAVLRHAGNVLDGTVTVSGISTPLTLTRRTTSDRLPREERRRC